MTNSLASDGELEVVQLSGDLKGSLIHSGRQKSYSYYTTKGR